MIKKRHFMMRTALAFFMVLCSVWGWGQTTIAFNGAEDAGTSLATVSNDFVLSNTNTGTPAERIKSGTKSFQQTTLGTKTLITTGVALNGYTSNYVELWNAMVSTTTGNGIDSTVDKLEVYVSETLTFSAIPDVTVNSSAANVRWGMNGAGIISTTAGTPTTYTYTTGGTRTGSTAFSKIIINLPSTWVNVYIKIIAVNNAAEEVWCIDDIAVKGTLNTIPTISSNPTSISGFTYIEGSGPSAEKNFAVTGSNLTGDITATAPTNWEVSATSGSGFGATATLPAAGGTIYARLAAGLGVNASYAGNVTLSSTGASNVVVNLSGSVTAPPTSPVVTGASLSGKVGTAFSHQVQATENPTAYAVASGTLPTGLTLNTTSGLISGTPTAAGTFNATISATSGSLTSAPAAFDFTIAQGTQTATLPDINANVGAADITLPLNTSAGLPISYVSDTPAVAGVTGNTLSIGTVGSATITATHPGNAAYAAFSDTFTVTVSIAPISLLEFEFAGILGDESAASSSSNVAELQSSTLSRGAGLTATANADRFNATSWSVGSIDNAVTGNDYMEFTIVPVIGYQVSVSSIYFQIQRSGTGLSVIALRSSVDNFATNLDTEKALVDNTNTQNFTFNFTQAASAAPVTYRLYGYSESALNLPWDCSSRYRPGASPLWFPFLP